MRDEIKKLLPSIQPHSRIAFVINTDPTNKPGQHWNAIYIDARNGPESSTHSQGQCRQTYVKTVNSS